MIKTVISHNDKSQPFHSLSLTFNHDITSISRPIRTGGRTFSNVGKQYATYRLNIEMRAGHEKNFSTQ